MPNFIDLKDITKEQLIDLISLSLKWKKNIFDVFCFHFSQIISQYINIIADFVPQFFLVRNHL